jgi:hypothetical protein
MTGVAGELGVNVPAGNVSMVSKAVYHNSGALGEESEADGVEEVSGSGSSAGVVDGSAAKIDSLGSVRSGSGVRLDN